MLIDIRSVCNYAFTPAAYVAPSVRAMPNPYREIFQAPGAFAFSGAGFIARLPASMVGLGIVTMLSERRGEYAIAGAVTATFALASALITPRSRHRQSLWPAPRLDARRRCRSAGWRPDALDLGPGAPGWLLFVFTLLAGLMPSIGAMVRALDRVLPRYPAIAHRLHLQISG